MSETAVAITEVIEPSEVEIPPTSSTNRVADMRLVAADPVAMAASQSKLVDWCRLKIRESRTALDELEENLTIARKNKWRTTALVNAVRREKQQITFYGKLFAALKAGYHIIPNFESDVFAIRTSKAAAGTADSTWGRQNAINGLPEQEAEALPVGEGTYQSPSPLGRIYDVDCEEDSTGKVVKTIHHAEVTDFGKIEFPFALAKSEVLTETQQAMAIKVFDEMAILPQRLRSRKGDPMVVGTIRKPWMKSWQPNNRVTFLVVWFLDTTAL